MFNQILKLTLISFLCLPFLSCTRAVDSRARVSFNTDSIGGLAYEDTVVILINITGQGEPLYYFWEKCRELDLNDCEPGTETPPTELYFEMPAGQNRLFQVLAAFEDGTTGETGFQYGDKAQSVPSGDVTISINLNDVGGGGEQFKFAGRYAIDDTPTYPSGIIETYYTPPGGKPAMYIEHSYMFEGYFELFGIDNAGFDYKLYTIDGDVIDVFSNVNLNTTSFPDADNIIRVSFPAYGQYDGTSWYGSFAEQFVLGFFSPDSAYTSAKLICYDDNSGSAIDNLDDLCSAPDGSGCGLGADPNLDWDWDILDGIVPESVVTDDVIRRMSGGVADLATCATDDFEGDEKEFDINIFSGNGFDRVKGFEGPFHLNNGGAIQADASIDLISWNYVSNPGLTNTYDGVDVFIRDNSIDPMDSDLFYFDCENLWYDPYVDNAYFNVTDTDPDVTLTGSPNNISKDTNIDHPYNYTAETTQAYDLLSSDIIIICPYIDYGGGNYQYLIGTAQYGNVNP